MVNGEMVKQTETHPREIVEILPGIFIKKA